MMTPAGSGPEGETDNVADTELYALSPFERIHLRLRRLGRMCPDREPWGNIEQLILEIARDLHVIAREVEPLKPKFALDLAHCANKSAEEHLDDLIHRVTTNVRCAEQLKKK